MAASPIHAYSAWTRLQRELLPSKRAEKQGPVNPSRLKEKKKKKQVQISVSPPPAVTTERATGRSAQAGRSLNCLSSVAQSNKPRWNHRAGTVLGFLTARHKILIALETSRQGVGGTQGKKKLGGGGECGFSRKARTVVVLFVLIGQSAGIPLFLVH